MTTARGSSALSRLPSSTGESVRLARDHTERATDLLRLCLRQEKRRFASRPIVPAIPLAHSGSEHLQRMSSDCVQSSYRFAYFVTRLIRSCQGRDTNQTICNRNLSPLICLSDMQKIDGTFGAGYSRIDQVGFPLLPNEMRSSVLPASRNPGFVCPEHCRRQSAHG